MQPSCKKLAVAGVLFIGSGSLWAQTLPASLRSCAKIFGDTARLACFDHEAARAATADPPRKELTGVKEPPAVNLSPEDKLGLSGQRVQQLESKGAVQPQKISELQAHIVHTSPGSYGHDVFELDNGQIWQQSESQANFTARPGDAVTVKKGALGSFWLSSGSRQATRVKRLR